MSLLWDVDQCIRNRVVKIVRIFIHPTPILMPVAQPCPTKQARDKRTGTVHAPPLRTDVVMSNLEFKYYGCNDHNHVKLCCCS